MAECDWAVFCDYAFLDARGKMCIIGIFDNIYAKQVPTIHPQAFLVVQLRGKQKEGVSIRIEVVRPGGTSLLRIDGSGQIGDGGGAAMQLSLSPLQLPDWGRYDCNVYVNDALAYTAKFSVLKPPVTGAH